MYGGNTKVTLIVAAAGYGKRMGLSYPKQFLKIEDSSIYTLPIKVAQNSDLIHEIIVVTGKEYIDDIKKECEELKLTKVKTVIAGGSERQYSIYNAIKVCDNGIIIVQDGARPFMKESYIQQALKVIYDENIDGVIIGVKTKDTIKVVDDNGIVISTPNRETLYLAQTPQIFKSKIIKKAYESAEKDSFLGTDDSSLVERIGGKVKVICGDYDNIKITTKEDIKFL